MKERREGTGLSSLVWRYGAELVMYRLVGRYSHPTTHTHLQYMCIQRFDEAHDDFLLHHSCSHVVGHDIIPINCTHFPTFCSRCRPFCVEGFEALILRWRQLLASAFSTLCPHAFVTRRWHIIADGNQPSLPMSHRA